MVKISGKEAKRVSNPRINRMLQIPSLNKVRYNEISFPTPRGSGNLIGEEPSLSNFGMAWLKSIKQPNTMRIKNKAKSFIILKFSVRVKFISGYG